MAKTINQSQRDLLDSGFLDGIGSAREEIEFDATFKSLVDLAKFLITETNKNLNKGKHTSSGRLADSFTVSNPSNEGNKISLDVSALPYFDYLNNGVKGTKSGSGRYSFKTEVINKDMLNSIRKWLIRKKLKQSKDRKFLRSTGAKTIEETSNGVAYAIARSIKQNGIKPTHYFTNAVQAANEYSKSILGKALKIDVINSLPDKI